jgi:hypothetical protein
MHRDVARPPPVCKCCVWIGFVTDPSARHRKDPIHDPPGTNHGSGSSDGRQRAKLDFSELESPLRTMMRTGIRPA